MSAQAPARCGHAQDGSPLKMCTLDCGHKGYHRGYGYVWCCPGEVRPAAQADDLTHDAGCERQIHEVCAAAPAPQQPPAPAEQGPAAEGLSLDRLLRTVAQVAMCERDDHIFNEAEDRAIERAAVLLTPAARVDLALDLLRGLPGAASATISVMVATPEDVAAAGQARRSLTTDMRIEHMTSDVRDGSRVEIWCRTPATAAEVAELLPTRAA